MSDSDPLWMGLIASLQTGAMIQLGKIIHPVTGQLERDLEQAKGTIDLLAMLERKCRGNLATDEQQFLEHVLFELRMNYLDESERPRETASATGTEAASPDAAGGSNGSDAGKS